jgi:hypothetical protein
MPVKKTRKSASKPAAGKPVNKTAFVQNLPTSMSAKDVVAKAKAAGITLTEMYVYSIRSKSNKSKGGKASGTKRGRPGKGSAAPSGGSPSVGGLVSQIEQIVERKVNAILQARFGALFGG